MSSVPIARGRWSYCLYGLICLCALSPDHARAVVTVSLVPSSPSTVLDSAGDPLVLDVSIDNPDGVEIRSWSLDVSFDPAVFDALPGVGAVPVAGFELGSYVPAVGGVLLPNWNENYENDGIAPDAARMGLLNTGSGAGAATSGILARLTLDAIGLSPGSQISLNGQLLMPGSIPVTDLAFEPALITVIPEPPASLLLALASIPLIGLLRPRIRPDLRPVIILRVGRSSSTP